MVRVVVRSMSMLSRRVVLRVSMVDIVARARW